MIALKNLDLENVVFIDIETVKGVEKLETGSALWDSWEYKLRYSREAEKFEEGTLAEVFDSKAALYAEFGKIVCITIGKVNSEGTRLNIKSYTGDDERALLTEFCRGLEGLIARNKKTVLCGHAITGFDVPFIMRRCLVNGVTAPSLIDVAHLKPWETTMVDTMNLWKGTGFYGASLINIAVAFGLPSPKSDIAGHETSDVYWKDKDLHRIARYCERDVLTVANIVRLCRGESILVAEAAQMKAEKPPLMEKIYNSQKVTVDEHAEINALVDSLDETEKKMAQEILKVTLPKTRVNDSTKKR